MDPESPSLDPASDPTIEPAVSSAPLLSFIESRVLGCLLEKEATTPEYYPLTLNALMAACNQSSNRDPVMDVDSESVQQAMEDLRYKDFAILVHQAGARVPKNKHTIEKRFPYLRKPEVALLCVLLLRGQQTLAELRQRTERLHSFGSLETAQEAMDRLIQHHPALVRRIPSGAGRRAETYVHLLCGEPDLSASHGGGAAPVVAERIVEEPTWRARMESDLEALREQVRGLSEEVARLRSDLGA
ncbi:MAG TPA: YceH family protein [Verrucomicrobiales bacterium]|nr:YceH family protein [Verrucomicrobiae bacterium]MCP5552028.1 YceH family protein [Akkermansiaceae bacterium]HRX54528.1 YceH family protein [Verrucomicrobiales bacterium]